VFRSYHKKIVSWSDKSPQKYKTKARLQSPSAQKEKEGGEKSPPETIPEKADLFLLQLNQKKKQPRLLLLFSWGREFAKEGKESIAQSQSKSSHIHPKI